MKSRLKRWLPWFGLAISLACAFYFVRAIANQWHVFTRELWHRDVILGMFAALLLYAATYAVAARSWQLVIRALGWPIRYLEVLRIITLSQFAKYLTANVGHHVGRVVLARHAGMHTGTVLTSMFLDIFLVVTAAAVCSLPVMALLLRVALEHGVDGERALAWILIAGTIAAVAVLAIPATRRTLGKQLHHLTLLPKGRSLRKLTQAWLSQCLSFALGGSALFLLCLVISGAPSALTSHWAQVIGVYATAWLLGLLIPGVPAGLGIRELVLLAGLAPLVGKQDATTAAALLRLVTMAGDGLIFLVAIRIGKGPSLTTPDHEHSS